MCVWGVCVCVCVCEGRVGGSVCVEGVRDMNSQCGGPGSLRAPPRSEGHRRGSWRRKRRRTCTALNEETRFLPLQEANWLSPPGREVMRAHTEHLAAS